MMCVCVWSNESNNIPTEAPWEAQVVLQVWGHQGLDRSDATDGGLSDIRMVVTSSTTASATEVVLPTSSCTEHPKIELPFVHDIAYRKDTIAMLNAIIYAQLCAQMHSLFRTHVSFFFCKCRRCSGICVAALATRWRATSGRCTFLPS